MTNICGHRKENTGSFTISVRCCYSIAKSHLTLCDPLDCSTPGFPVLHILEISLSDEEPINTIFKKERWEGGGIKDTIERNSKNKNIIFKKLEKKKKIMRFGLTVVSSPTSP